MRYLILGDTHTYFKRVVSDLKEALKLHSYDAIIQVGDLAYLPKIWSQLIQEENQMLIDFVNENNLKFYWIDGNHEDHSVLQHIDDFNNSIHNVYGKNFYYQPRGSYIELKNHILFFIGGAETRDVHMRKEGIDFFREEIVMRFQEEFIFNSIETIKTLNKPVIVIAHTCPLRVIEDERNIFNLKNNFSDLNNIPSGNYQNKILDEILDDLKPSMWFHGHFHQEKIYTLPDVNFGKTTFFSIGGYLSIRNNFNDKKYFIIDL